MRKRNKDIGLCPGGCDIYHNGRRGEGYGNFGDRRQYEADGYGDNEAYEDTGRISEED